MPTNEATPKQQRTYFYTPPKEIPSSSVDNTHTSSTSTSTTSTPTFVLNKEALELPIQAQRSLKVHGFFVSVTGALFTHRDPRIAPAPVWVRLLSPTRSLVYIAQLLYLLYRLRLNLFPSILVLFLALDSTLQKCINVDGEHCANLSSLASILVLCCLAGDHFSFALSSVDDYYSSVAVLTEAGPPLILSSSAAAATTTTATGAAATGAATSLISDGFSSLLFPRTKWSKLIVWPIGATFGLGVLQVVFVRCTSFVWIAGWTALGAVVCVGCLLTVGDQVEVYGTLALAAILSTAMIGGGSGSGSGGGGNGGGIER